MTEPTETTPISAEEFLAEAQGAIQDTTATAQSEPVSEVKAYTTTMREKPFRMDDKDYVIRELDGIHRGIYLDSVSARVVISDMGKPVGMKSFKGLETSLLKLCVRKDGELVPEKTLISWPSHVLSELFDDAMVLSGLDEETKKSLKAKAKKV